MITEKKAANIRFLYKQKKFNRINTLIFRELELFNRIVYLNLDEKAKNHIERFLGIFFELILKDDFKIGKFVKQYLSHITLIENITYLSKHLTTQKILDQLLYNNNAETAKILLLMNLRTVFDFKLVDRLFQTDPVLGSYWVYSLFTRHSFCNDIVSSNLRTLQSKIIDYDLYPFENISSLYFNSTYVDPDNHLKIRKKVNHIIKKHISLADVENLSGNNKIKKIAVISKNWQNNKAVKKCIGAFIKGLSNDFNLTFVEIENNKNVLINHYFDRHLKVKKEGDFINYSSIMKNDFNMAIFTDVGLNTESIVLSNLRIAPVQLTMYGHPVSTVSDEMDYFTVGRLSETSNIDDHYSENTLMIKGTGMNSMKPALKRPTFIEKQNYIHKKIINIYITASLPKINPIIRVCWNKILGKSRHDIVYHLLPGNGGMQEVSTLRKDLELYLGKKNFVVYKDLNYEDYMNVIKCCDIAIGSFHYGDYNRIIDSLWMGTPVVVVRGDCGYQNTGVGALRAIGLNELISNDLDDYVNKILELIDKRKLRTNLQRKVLAIDISKKLINNKDYIEDFNRTIKKLLL